MGRGSVADRKAYRPVLELAHALQVDSSERAVMEDPTFYLFRPAGKVKYGRGTWFQVYRIDFDSSPKRQYVLIASFTCRIHEARKVARKNYETISSWR